MAKVSAHGTEIGTIYFSTSAKRYMSDGTILKHHGFGWKLAGKIKPEFTPESAFRSAVEHQRKALADRPAFAAYRKLLHEAAGMDKRWKLNAAISMMPDDPDGVWSECCDGYSDNVHCDLDEIVALCRAYKVALMENDDIRKESVAA